MLRSRPRLRSRILLFALLGLAALPSVAQEGSDMEGVVEYHGFPQIKIAVPDLALSSGAGDVERELIQTLRDDLEFSGFFDIVDPLLYQLVPATGGEVRHDDWLSIAETFEFLPVEE